MPAPEGNDYAVGNDGGAPEGNQNAVGNDGGAPVGNGNAITHGATASPINLLDHLSEEELQWVESLVDAYLDRAPFGPHDGRVERLTRTCVMIFQEWRAEEAVLEEGLSHDVVVDVTSSGEPVVRTEEHYLSRRMDRLNDKIRHNLRDLGLLSEDDREASVVGSTFQSNHMTVTISEPSSSSSEIEDVDDD